jgi:plastocyanin
MRMFLIAAALFASAAPSFAATLTVTLKTPGGQPVKDAVVTIATPGAHDPLKVDGPLRMAQQNLQFDPFVLIVPVGADVAFPNLDKVRHHVYSFSPTKRFEIKLYGHDETRTEHFDKAGAVALGCNIHDHMIGFIRVVDTPYAAKTNAAGVAVLHDAPAGRLEIKVWQPYLKAPDNEVAESVTAPAQGEVAANFTIDVRPPDTPMR